MGPVALSANRTWILGLEQILSSTRAGQPCWLPAWNYRPGLAGITILVIAAVAPPAARGAEGAAVEIAGCGSVGGVVGASPASRG